MLDEDDESEIINHEEGKPEETRKRQAKKIVIPRREPSVEIPQPRILVMTAGFKPKPIKLNQCLISPLTLYEISAAVVDKLAYPVPFEWDEEQVADWMERVVGLPQYKECIIDNHINGRRLLRLEDPSVLPEINIRDFTHIKKITSEIRKVFMADYVLFARSVGLPIRKPLTHCTWFKSRTGPSWGIRQNWTRCDILRWMKIILPEPVYRDHWDLVWYQRPDWPKELTAKIPAVKRERLQYVPHYKPPEDIYCYEYTAVRRFRIQANIPEEAQFIWMEHLPGSPSRIESKYKEEESKKRKKKRGISLSLFPEKVSLTGLAGKDLVLARRKMAKPKFLA